jgi:hypothetical protein
MEVNDKITELEEQLKLLKAEIRNVLLDIREVILEKRNPLGEEHESAFIRMDLNTTARAMASEAAAHEASKVAHEADDEAEGHAPATDESAPVEAEKAEPPPAAEPAPAPETAASTAPQPEKAASAAATAVRDEYVETAEIPQMFMADLAPLSGNGSLAEWVTQAIDAVGVEDLRRVITMFRLWGNVPPNISRALAHLQELLATSDEPRPAWLRVLQDLDRLASL